MHHQRVLPVVYFSPSCWSSPVSFSRMPSSPREATAAQLISKKIPDKTFDRITNWQINTAIVNHYRANYVSLFCSCKRPR